jgi:hypothetical protein
VENEVSGSPRPEAFYLFYDPPATPGCKPSPNEHEIAVGDSYLIRLASNGATGMELLKVTKYADVKASGLTLAAGRTDVIIASGGKGQTARVQTQGANPLAPSSTSTTPVIEAWNEVH